MAVHPVHLTVVIPAFNEGQNLSAVVESTLRTLGEQPWGHGAQLVVVDDGSVDDTGAVARRLAERDDRVFVAVHPANRGFGAAVRTGYAASTGEFVTTIPADGEVKIEEALKLLSLMDGADGADLAVSRRIRSMPAHREWLTRTFHALMRSLTGFDSSDMDGIFVIRRAILEQLPLQSTTGLVHAEVLMRCVRRGCSVRTGTMQASPRLSGQSKVANVRTVAKIFIELVKLRWRLK